jgi:hypothetical protein
MVPCLFLSHPSKKQLHVCGVFRKKVTIVCEQQISRMSQFEQQATIKFCQKLGNSGNETFQMIKQEYSEETLGRSAVFKCHKRFAHGRDSLEDDEQEQSQHWCMPTSSKW